ALVVANAVGDVIGSGGEVIAGPRDGDGRLLRSAELIPTMDASPEVGRPGENTTLVCVCTDASLDKRGCGIIARMASAGVARTVLNVGAGSGSYEPHDRAVTAVEPSAVMIAHRPPGAAPAVQAHAEALPFPDSSFDAAMAILSDHHWDDRAVGLRELRRVARRQVVLFTWDPRFADAFWLTRDYMPASKRLVPGMA